MRVGQRYIHPLLLLFLGALALRIVAYFVFNYLLFEGEFIHPDSVFYHQRSVEIAESWRQGSLHLVRYPAYANLIAALYTVFGPYRILPELVNLVAGAFLPILVYLLGRKVFTEKVGYVGGVLAAIDPLLIYESTQFLRDVLLTCLVLGTVLGAVYWRERLWISWVGGIFSLLGVCFLLNRPVLAVGLAMALAATTLLSLVLRRPSLPHWSYSTVVVLVVWLSFFTSSPGTQTQAVESSGTVSEGSSFLGRVNAYGESLRSPQFTNEFFNELNTGIGPFEDYIQFGLYLPVAGLKGLFYPLPWLADSGLELVFGTYMLWWYGIILLGIGGLLVSSWNWAKFLSIMLAGTFLLGLGLGGPVMSGLIRWRLPVTVLMLVWASQVLVWVWDIWRVKCIRDR